MGSIDCMACLVALARGLPEGGTYVDTRGVTHATLRTQHLDFITCATRLDPNNPGRALIDLTRCRMAPNER